MKHQSPKGEMMNPIVNPDDFPAAQNSTYLNAANVALMYSGAEKTVAEWQKDVAENGSINFDESAEASVFDELHVVAARLFNAAPEDIAVGSSATELLSSLAWAVAPGPNTNVVSTDIVFPSTIYPWQRVANYTGCEIRFTHGQNSYANPDEIIQLIDKETKVVCISHVEYLGGQRFDLARIGEAAHERGALFVVDASQSAGAIPIDVSGYAIDALVCGGYKWLCGPFGAAVMYLDSNLHTALEPGLVGFRSHADMWDLRADRIEYPKTAKRFEYSTMAFGCALGLTRSIEFLLNIGIERVFKYNKYLSDELIQGLRERDVEIISPLNEAERTSIITARFQGQDSMKISQKLKAARVTVSCRRDIIRFSPHVYNNRMDIQRTLECIDNI